MFLVEAIAKKPLNHRQEAIAIIKANVKHASPKL